MAFGISGAKMFKLAYPSLAVESWIQSQLLPFEHGPQTMELKFTGSAYESDIVFPSDTCTSVVEYAKFLMQFVPDEFQVTPRQLASTILFLARTELNVAFANYFSHRRVELTIGESVVEVDVEEDDEVEDDEAEVEEVEDEEVEDEEAEDEEAKVGLERAEEAEAEKHPSPSPSPDRHASKKRKRDDDVVDLTSEDDDDDEVIDLSDLSD